jgi:hypothetical protein
MIIGRSIVLLVDVEAAKASLWNWMKVSNSSRHHAVELAFLVLLLARNLDNLENLQTRKLVNKKTRKMVCLFSGRVTVGHS